MSEGSSRSGGDRDRQGGAGLTISFKIDDLSKEVVNEKV